MDGTILLADDDRTIRTVLSQALTRAGCKVHATSSLTTLLRWVEEGRGDVVITDVMMPDGNGLEFVPKMIDDRPDLPVIVISAQNTIMTAIEAKKVNAFEYLPKPFDLPDLMKSVRRALSIQSVKTRAAPQEAEARQTEELPLIGQSEAMQLLYKTIARLLNINDPTLIHGPSGVGKTLIARILHDYSDRRTLPFLSISPESLVPLEAPAAILDKVRSGTLVIESIEDSTHDVQGRIVRMLEDLRQDAPRVLVTSKRPLAAAVADGRFREDLYFRIAGHEITVPSLAERIEDLAALTHSILSAQFRGSAAPILEEAGLHVLQRYSWPGNVRQLNNVMSQALAVQVSGRITKDHIEGILLAQPAADAVLAGLQFGTMSKSILFFAQKYFDSHTPDLPPAGVYARLLAEFERPVIEVALAATSGNQAKCADLLGINRNTLRKKIKELGLNVTRGRRMM